MKESIALNIPHLVSLEASVEDEKSLRLETIQQLPIFTLILLVTESSRDHDFNKSIEHKLFFCFNDLLVYLVTPMSMELDRRVTSRGKRWNTYGSHGRRYQSIQYRDELCTEHVFPK